VSNRRPAKPLLRRAFSYPPAALAPARSRAGWPLALQSRPPVRRGRAPGEPPAGPPSAPGRPRGGLAASAISREGGASLPGKRFSNLGTRPVPSGRRAGFTRPPGSRWPAAAYRLTAHGIRASERPSNRVFTCLCLAHDGHVPRRWGVRRLPAHAPLPCPRSRKRRVIGKGHRLRAGRCCFMVPWPSACRRAAQRNEGSPRAEEVSTLPGGPRPAPGARPCGAASRSGAPRTVDRPVGRPAETAGCRGRWWSTRCGRSSRPHR